MNTLQQWAFSVCAAMVACGLIRILAPKSSMEKVFNLTVSVFFLCCLLSPVLLKAPELRVDFEEISQQDIQWRVDLLQEESERQAVEAARYGVREVVEEKLREMGIKWEDISINISTNGQNSAQIHSVQVVVNAQTQKSGRDAAEAALGTALGVPVRVEVEQEGGI